MQNESDYLVRNPKLIVDYLTDIFKSKCLISAHFGENNAFFLTAIIELDPKHNSLKIDCAPTELLNNQLLNSSKVLFRTEIDGIKASFSGKSIKISKSYDQPAFEMPIPNSIFWLQRRQFYRVKVPLSHTGTYCVIARQTNDELDAPLSRAAVFSLADLSITGLALLNPDPELACLFSTKTAFTDCTLFLHESTHANIDFAIKNITEIKVNANTTQQRIGCLITKVTPSFESSIQRYMRCIERQLKNIG